jgi:glycosyltransferase involved in cell wall biosynthesis
LKNPLVSVVIPIRNLTSFVPLAIRSVVQQTYTNYEILVLHEDMSKDDLRFIKNLASEAPKFRLVLSDKYRTLAETLNAGIEICDGKYFARFDSDDIMFSTRLSKQIDFLERNPEYVVVGGQRYLIDQNGTFLGSTWPYPKSDRSIRKRLPYNSVLPHPGSTIRLDVLKQISGYSTNFPAGEDYELWLRLMQYGKLANLKEVVIAYRIHINSKSSLEGESLENWSKLAQEIHGLSEESFLTFTQRSLVKVIDRLSAFIWKYLSRLHNHKHNSIYETLRNSVEPHK